MKRPSLSTLCGLLAVVLLVPSMALASVLPAADGESADDMFTRARELGFAGNREEAREICRTILKDHPTYHEVRVFLGRLHAWDKEYDSARREFNQVLKEAPDNVDARIALIDVELWSKNPHDALTHANTGLEKTPGNSDLLYRKAKALEDLDMSEEALVTAREAASADPQNKEARKLVEKLERPGLKNKIGLGLAYEDVSNDRDSGGSSDDEWKFGSLDYSRRFSFGSVIFRYNWAERFDNRDRQFEIDAYPSISTGYFYVNVGYSAEGGFFPDWRYGGEYFHGFPKSWEGSIGFRYMDFGQSDSITYTGTVGRYYGPHFTFGRVYYSPSSLDDIPSLTIFHRHYWGDRDSYIELSFGGGQDIEDDPLSGTSTPESTLTLDTLRAAVKVSKTWRGHWIFSGKLGWREEEFPGFVRTRYTLAFGIERRF